jgi:hypothetical protein
MTNKLWSLFKNSENKYIVYCAIFAAVYFFWALPYLIKTIDGNLFMQFLIFDVGVIAFLNIYLKSKSLGTSLSFVKSIEYMLVVLAIAIFIPPYSVIPWTGEIQSSALLSSSAVDFFFGTIGHDYLYLNGIWVSIWTFVIVPTGLLYLAKKISSSNFVRRV